ncbi:MAG TPA: SH3 domain-containing protein [Bauldia sp.]|nr:SH3 domain-containing protein [Bauldia sp.]
MASENNGNPSISHPRLSPGEAAFERLTRREALKSKDAPGTVDGAAAPAGTAAEVERPAPAAAEAKADAPMEVAAAAEPASASAEIAVSEADRAPAPVMAGNAPEEAAPPTATPHVPAAVEPGVDRPAARILAVAVALGVEPTSSPAGTKPPATAAESAPPAVEAKTPRPAARDATAEKLEAALLDQLKSLEETLLTPPRMPKAEPLRPAQVVFEAPDFIGPPRRSPFAPDPVRQRTYVDLRMPAPEPDAAAGDDAPWRKYLDEPRARISHHVPARLPPPRPERALAAAPVYEHKNEFEDRGHGIRAMSAAAILGLGVGLGLVVLMRPFAEPTALSVATPEPGAAPVVAAAPAATAAPKIEPPAKAADGPMDRALATLLAEPGASPPAAVQPAVISEPGVTVTAAAAAAPSPPAPAAEPPVVIRPPPGETPRVARAPDFQGAEPGPLAYVPAIPSYDPVRQSLLEAEAPAREEDGSDSAEEAPARVASRDPAQEPAATPVSPGRATINAFVNMRAKPDNAAPVVAILAEGLSVKVLGCDYWCEVEAGGKRGFVFKKFVSR